MIRKTVESITGYTFEKISDENSATNIDTRIVNEITRATNRENALDVKIEDAKTALQEEIEDRIASESAISVVILELQEKIN